MLATPAWCLENNSLLNRQRGLHAVVSDINHQPQPNRNSCKIRSIVSECKVTTVFCYYTVYCISVPEKFWYQITPTTYYWGSNSWQLYNSVSKFSSKLVPCKNCFIPCECSRPAQFWQTCCTVEQNNFKSNTTTKENFWRYYLVLL